MKLRRVLLYCKVKSFTAYDYFEKSVENSRISINKYNRSNRIFKVVFNCPNNNNIASVHHSP